MSAVLRTFVLIILWVAVLGALLFWFGGREVTRLSIAAGAANSESFELATAIADVIEETYPRLRVDVYETQGSRENVALIEAGAVDFAAVQADSSVSGDVRVVATLFADAYQLVVTADSGVQSPHDLKGLRVAIPPEGSGQNWSFWFVMDHYRITPDDITALPMSDAAANFAMQQGQVDAVFRVRAPGNPLVHELVRDQANMRLVPIDQPEAMALKQPTIRAGQLPVGSYRGYPALPGQTLETAFIDRILVSRADLDEDTVFAITRMLFERRAALVRQSNLAGFIRPLGDADQVAIPMHEGARRYYDREKPSLVEANSRLLAAVLYVCALLTSVFLALRSRIKKARRVRVGDYNLELIGIADEAAKATSVDGLEPLQQRLVQILSRVVHDLDADRVSDDEFNQFSFTWQAVDRVVRDRRDRLGEAAA